MLRARRPLGLCGTCRPIRPKRSWRGPRALPDGVTFVLRCGVLRRPIPARHTILATGMLVARGARDRSGTSQTPRDVAEVLLQAGSIDSRGTRAYRSRRTHVPVQGEEFVRWNSIVTIIFWPGWSS